MVSSSHGRTDQAHEGEDSEQLSPIEQAAQEDILDDRVTAPSEPPQDSTADSNGRLAEAEAEISKLKGDYLRALADVENTRRRAARDRDDANRYAISKFANDLLSVADNMRRALESVDQAMRAESPALESLLNGVEMTEKELLSVFDRHGVTKIDALGTQFDPHVHEAMFELPKEDVPNGTVVHVLREGYRIADRVLRPAQVGVSKGGPKEPVPAEGETGASEPSAEETETPSDPSNAARSTADAYEKSAEPSEPKTGSNIDQTT